MSCRARVPLKTGALEDGHFVREVPLKPWSRREPGRFAHQVVVTIADGKVSTKEMPVVYKRGKRFESVSDGGFYNFEGCLLIEEDHYHVDLRLMSADYAEPDAVSTKTYSIKPRAGGVDINGKFYRRVAEPETW